MSIRGSLKLTDEAGEEREVRCTGDLTFIENTDGGTIIRGQLHIYDEGDVEAAQHAMEQQARSTISRETLARYSGEVYNPDRQGTRAVTDVPMMIQGFDGANNATVESTGVEG